MRAHQLFVAACLIVPGSAVSSDDLDESVVAQFEDVNWQSGDAAIMTLFEPYIGVFASTVKTSPSGTRYFFKVGYDWYDRDRTIVKYTLTIEFPEKDEVRDIGEGYYRFDRVSGRIAVVGVFRDGRSGAGYVTPFDLETGSREVRIRTAQPDGTTGEVRDTFWIIDDETWGNRTFIRSGNAPWKQVSEDIYSRIAP